MKNFVRFFARSLPFVAGIICTLTAFSFLVSLLVELSNHPKYFSNSILDKEKFWAFVIFAVIGLPLILFGINRLSSDK